MNKTAVTARVAERSGVPADVCADVIDALEAVLQEELAAKGAGVLSAFAAILKGLAANRTR
ncbi:MAG: hypothetical protein LIQ31_00110 [Planctomycetes bacterium]|nr:hypothetical protein [Planctomycetota bacterium]